MKARSLLLVSMLATTPAPAQTRSPETARLAWLEGRWTGSQDGVEMEETWSSPSGGALLGLHKDVKGGRMVSFEFLRIEKTPREGVVYFASPRSAPPTPFRMIELGDRRVVFANQGHDFPQRILYWLDDRGSLHARVEGQIQGKPRAEEWVWTRTR